MVIFWHHIQCAPQVRDRCLIFSGQPGIHSLIVKSIGFGKVRAYMNGFLRFVVIVLAFAVSLLRGAPFGFFLIGDPYFFNARCSMCTSMPIASNDHNSPLLNMEARRSAFLPIAGSSAG